MSAAFVSLLANRVLVFSGWSLVMILWETSVVAALFAIWRVAKRPRAARLQYSAAVVAFSAATVVALATPVALLAVPVRSAAIRVHSAEKPQGPVVQSVTAADAGLPATDPVRTDFVTARSLDALAGAAAAAWAIGVVLLAARLYGGWMVARRVARTARPIASPELANALDAFRTGARPGAAVPVLQSSLVDAPVVLGWRRPMVIIPDHAAGLTTDTLAPLLAHELAHIRRGDYAANICQSAIELLLFFSPAVAWISRRIREAREYCCDDDAVHTCGDATSYARALTTVAALDVRHSTQPALGAAGPRLITHVRRLLQEERMPKLNPWRIAGLVAVVAVLLVIGMRMSATPIARAAGAIAAAPVQDRIPYGWQSEPDGAGVKLVNVVSTTEAPTQSVTVRNVSTQPITGVQFVAAVEQFSRGSRVPVRLFSSELLPVMIPVGGEVALSPEVVPAGQLQRVVAEAGGARVQFFFGVQRVSFANGFEWSITPNPAAATGADALNIPRLVYSRDLILRDAGIPEKPYSACRDDRNHTTSHGGAVAILNEPGMWMRCQNGRGVEAVGR
jgi:beta-lactamase regulating signal transducer with metallopeptidase domain